VFRMNENLADVCKYCDKRHTREDMCVQAMRVFIQRKNRIKKVKPFSAKNIDKNFFKKVKKINKRKFEATSDSIIDLTESGMKIALG